MRPVSDQLFTFAEHEPPRLGYERCSAKDLGLDEAWLRDAIYANPDLVIGPCRAADLTDDDWYAWQREYRVEVGQIDVLLLASEGRVAIVETKLMGNPELRRRVFAQTLDYLAHLPERFEEDELPAIPLDSNGQPVADREDILESVGQSDVLLIIASDDIDLRLAKLSRTLLGNHLVKQWDLALVDVALYRPLDAPGQCLVVPHLRHVVRSEPRQVVRVVIEGEAPSARVEIERITPDQGAPARQQWDEIRFFRYLEDGEAPGPVRELALKIRDLAHRYPESLTLAWGTGRHGNMILKRHNGALVQIGGRGGIRFRPRKFTRALGETAAAEYRQALERLVPEAMAMAQPLVGARQAAAVARPLLAIIQQTLEGLETTDG
jgi:hypothetical protein